MTKNVTESAHIPIGIFDREGKISVNEPGAEDEELPEPNQEENGLLTYTLLTTEIPEIRFISDGLMSITETARHDASY